MEKASGALETWTVLALGHAADATLRMSSEAAGEAPSTGDTSGGVPRGYTTEAPLGEGAVGAVWLAREAALDREVALKVLRTPSQVAHASLLHEAKVLAQLEHPAIPPIYALGRNDDKPYLAMRRVEGVTLRELSADPDHPAWTEWTMGTGDRDVAIVEIFVRIAEALAHAHERGLLHRDVKPANVIVGPLGQVFLVDWGIAVPVGTKPTASAVAGTPAYLAPEMVTGNELTPATDVFLLGATLHAVLTGGSHRHAGATIPEILEAAVRSEPAHYDASVSTALAELANSATARDPGERPASAVEFRDRLRAFRRGRLAEAFVTSVDQPLAELEATCGKFDDEALALAERLASVVRYVLRQAEEMGAPAGSVARSRGRAAVALFRLHVARRDPAPARIALEEAPQELRASLEAELTSLEGEKGRDEERLGALESTWREHDPDAGARYRPRLAVGFFVLIVLTIALGRTLVGPHDGPSRPTFFFVSGGFAVVALALLYGFRKRLATSRPNRVVATFLIACIVGRTLMRVVDTAYDESLLAGFSRELVLFGCLAVVAAVATRVPLFYALAVVFVVGAAASTVIPGATLIAYDITLAGALVVSLAFSVWSQPSPGPVEVSGSVVRDPRD
ncbi:MAG: serine/threonine protein kinase [Polyangiaceae bacterium]|nr:serine/threonine protein kinase [Polyangiaceae bacterium]